MSQPTLTDPFNPPNGLTLTPFHLAVLFFGALSLMASQLNLPPGPRVAVGMWQRAMVLLVVRVTSLTIAHASSLVIYSLISNQITLHRARTQRIADSLRVKELHQEAELEKQKNDWANPSAHPSHFLTTRDGKPRLFPFPLGKAGGSAALKGELWWEAGNTPHVGHYNQRETPEAQEALREEMQAKEKERADNAKKIMTEYAKGRKKWAKRLANLKILSGIVVLGLFHRKAAVICLAGLVYYVLATELHDMLKPPDKDEKEPKMKRRKIPITPGMGMTYLYEPTKLGGVKELQSIPVKAPSHRLMTSTDSRFAS